MLRRVREPRLPAARNAEHRQWKDFRCLRGAGNTQTFNPSFARGKTQKTSRNLCSRRAQPRCGNGASGDPVQSARLSPRRPRCCRGRCLSTSYVDGFHSATCFKVAEVFREAKDPARAGLRERQATVSMSHFGARSGGSAIRIFRFRSAEIRRISSAVSEKSNTSRFSTI